jgi:hypothetical protein
MDITDAQAQAAQEDQGQTIEIRTAAGEPELHDGTPVTITVVGLYSDTYRRIYDRQREQIFKRGRRALTGEALRRQQIELVAACIRDWHGFTNGGLPFPYTKDNAVALLNAVPWIREQVEEAMGDHAGFFKSALPS